MKLAHQGSPFIISGAGGTAGEYFVLFGMRILFVQGRRGIKGQPGEEPEDGRVKFEGAIYTSPLLGKNFLFWGANGECHEGVGEWRFGSVAVSS
jgi:hypothetical protein